MDSWSSAAATVLRYSLRLFWIILSLRVLKSKKTKSWRTLLMEMRFLRHLIMILWRLEWSYLVFNPGVFHQEIVSEAPEEGMEVILLPVEISHVVEDFFELLTSEVDDGVRLTMVIKEGTFE